MILSAFVRDIPLAIVRRYTRTLKYTNKNLNKVDCNIYRGPQGEDDLALFLAAFPIFYI